MAKIKTKNLKEGMILADDVRDQNGMLILSQGQSISEKHLRTFKSWGITEIDIEDSIEAGHKVGSIENHEKNFPVELINRVDELFRYTDKQHPAIVELMELCKLRKMELHEESV